MMFVHICRVCCGGNILVASIALMFCILMSLAEIQAPSSKPWGIGPALLLLPSVEIWCICFGRWDSSALFLCYENSIKVRQIETTCSATHCKWYLWRWRRWGQLEKRKSNYSHHEDGGGGDDDGDNDVPQFSRGLWEAAQSFSPSQVLFSHHFSSWCFLLTVHFPVLFFFCIFVALFSCLTLIFYISVLLASVKHAEIPQQSFVLCP